MAKQATIDNYDDVMKRDPKILHLSCHGVTEAVKKEGSESQMKEKLKKYSNRLLFERNDGLAFDFKDSLIVQASDVRSLDLVFIAAC